MGKLKNIWTYFVKWVKETALPWFLKSWIQIVNVLVVLYAYGKLLDGAEMFKEFPSGPAALVGLWAFVLISYWILKFFGFDKMILPLLKKLWKKIFGKK